MKTLPDLLMDGIHEFFHKGDVVLLFLCLLASGYGLVLVYSATRYLNTNRNVIVQAVAVVLGVIALTRKQYFLGIMSLLISVFAFFTSSTIMTALNKFFM